MSPTRRVAALLALAALPAAAAPFSLVLEDPRGDDSGPGTYLMPTGSEYRAGDFDLRRFSVRVEGKDAVIEVTLGTAIRNDVVPERSTASNLDLSNGLSLQNVDIYVDTTPGAGFAQGLPGRRVAFAPEEAWDVAITLTPQPGAMRSVLHAWDRAAAKQVLTPGPIRSIGPTLSARVPLWQLGGEPKATWGWSVMVSGALWESSFKVLERLRGGYEVNAFTMPVYAIPEEQAFGGGTVNGNQPYVIDVILPAGRAQAQVLGSYTADRFAVVPMVYPSRPKAAPAAAPDAGVPLALTPALDVAAPLLTPQAAAAAPEPSRPDAGAPLALQIASIEGDTAVIPTPQGGLKPWQIGIVLDAGGRRIGRVVVTTVAEKFVLATVAEGGIAVRPGARVDFGRSPAAQ